MSIRGYNGVRSIVVNCKKNIFKDGERCDVQPTTD